MEIKTDAFSYSKSKMKTPAQYAKSVQSYKKSHERRFGVFIVNFEQFSLSFVQFPLLILNKNTQKHNAICFVVL